MNKKLLYVLHVLYVLGVIVTFGHAWAHFTTGAEDLRVARAALCGAAWPFYWSGWLWAQS